MKKLSIVAALLFAFVTVSFAQDAAKATDKKTTTTKKSDSKTTTKKTTTKTDTKKSDKKDMK